MVECGCRCWMGLFNALRSIVGDGGGDCRLVALFLEDAGTTPGVEASGLRPTTLGDMYFGGMVVGGQSKEDDAEDRCIIIVVVVVMVAVAVDFLL
jgi:hypothetical protein